ncbi:ABC transporter ATP-binding protein [Streptococcus cristatus]|uniref:ABC transporter ATP-binding protein n=1 Tax=Streptococcus cristatus TaxID=45634 RepID=UPI0022851AE4|nr:ATP-binding cassette domain-containing protein [Streptococcus cristatus]MCY7218438.1 ATP-binding cassette domain-containing protein [Streptococcus cristatus]
MLVVDKVSKSYKNVNVLNDVSFEVQAGEIVGLVGANGAGKSTLIKGILGLHNIDSGRITFCQDDNFTKNPDLLNDIGYLMDIELFDYLTAREHIHLMGLYEQVIYNQEDIQQVLSRVSLKDDKKKVKDYSYGMKQRLRLALAVLRPRKLLILDEPLLGLDIKTIQEFKKYLKEIAESGVSILLSSHQLSEIEDLIDRYLILSDGTIEQEVDGGKIAYRLTIKARPNQLTELLVAITKNEIEFQQERDKENCLLVPSQEDLNKILKEIYSRDLEVQIEQMNIVNQLFLEK